MESILPDTLQEFLDEDCISGKGVVTAEEFSITFDYGFLAPPLLNEDMALPSDEQEVSNWRAMKFRISLLLFDDVLRGYAGLLPGMKLKCTMASARGID